MTPPKVSIIMASHNGAQYIGEAIEGILGQSFSDWELIVRDDSSSDATRSIVESFRDPRVKLLPARDHVGAAQARNEALGKAVGEFMAIHDADDISEPERLQEQVAFLEANPQIVIVGTAATVTDATGNVLEIRHVPAADDAIKREGFERGCPFVHPSVMFRRDVLKLEMWYDARFEAAHDYDLLLRIMERFPCANLSKALYRYRHVGASITGRNFLRQCAYSELARERSAVRRTGCDPDVGEWGERSRKQFEMIKDGRFPRKFRAAACRQRARWLMDHGFSLQALAWTLRSLYASGPTRDSFWMLRQTIKSLFRSRHPK